MRSIVDVIAPTAPHSSLRSLSTYLATPPLPNVRYGLAGSVENHFFNSELFITNRYGFYVLRNGQRLNNDMAIVHRFRVGIPTDDPSWAWLENTTIDLGVLTSSGGVRLRTRAPGGTWQDVISEPDYYRSRFHCASPASRITLHVGEWTEVELINNISDGDSNFFTPMTYTRANPLPTESPTYVAGAYGASGVMGGFRWGTTSLPDGIPIITPDDTACGKNFFHPDDPQLATAPQGTMLHADLTLKNYYKIPKELTQVITSDALENGIPSYCNVTE